MVKGMNSEVHNLDLSHILPVISGKVGHISASISFSVKGVYKD